MFYCETCQLKFEGKSPLYDLYWENGQRCPACNGFVQAYKAMAITDKPPAIRFQGVAVAQFLEEEKPPVYESENNLGTVFVDAQVRDADANELLVDYKEGVRNVIRLLSSMDFSKNYEEFKQHLNEEHLLRYVQFFAKQATDLYVLYRKDVTPERWAEMALASTLIFRYLNETRKEEVK